MNCTQCNATVPENSLFCPECGAKVEAPAPASAIFCENCGAALAADAQFCENCGSKVGVQPPVETVQEAPVAQEPTVPANSVFCPNCGAAMEANALFCENCGAKTAVAPVETPAAPKKNPVVDFIKKIPPKHLKLGLIGLAAVVVLIVAVCLIVNLTAKQDYTLYVKDGELVYSQLPEGNLAIELTSKLSDSSMPSTTMGYALRDLLALSEDGKTLFFPDKITYGGLSGYYGTYISDYSLYYQDISDPDSEAERIATSVVSHVVSQKGDLVTYLKNDTLYQSDLKEETKIAKNVSKYNYFVSKDGKTILYITTNSGEYSGSLYIAKNGEDPDKIASGVNKVVYINDNFDTFLYQKENTLYRANKNGEHEKLLNDAGNLVHVYSDSSIYYTTTEETEISFWDLIENDIKEETYNQHNIEYVRLNLQEAKMPIITTKLYYFDGDTSHVVSENFESFVSKSYTSAQIVYYEAPAVPPTVKLSEVLDIFDSFYYYYEDAVEEALANAEQEQEGTTKLTVKNVAYTLESAKILDVLFADDGKTAYVFADCDDVSYYATYNCNVYKVSVSDSGLGEMTLVDEDVSSNYYMMNGGRLIYFKDVDGSMGELHIDGKMIDNNVLFSSVTYCSETDAYAFLADYNEGKAEGTLMEYKNGALTEVKDEVFALDYSPCGNLLFLYDYNKSRGEGELWIQNGRKCYQLDEDVNAIIPIY